MKRSLEVHPVPDWHMPLIIIGSWFIMTMSAFGAILLYGYLS